MIFVVEDDHGVRELELYALRQSGYEAEGYETPTAFRQALEKAVPDCVLLDVMLPGEDGLSLLRFLRRDARTRRVPVILVTARDAEMDKVNGLDCGADDYLTKPFSTEELLARIRAVSRRLGEVLLDEMQFADLTLNLANCTLSGKTKSIKLGYKEFEIMKLLMANPGAIISKDELLVKVWGYESDAEDNNVEVYISFLRKKLHFLESAANIATVRKIGYHLEGDA